jgi:uncharacterized membrane protein YgdD (TMEM256/DUF423 family)
MRPWLAIAAALGFTAVLLGALAAHALRGHLSDASLETFRTGTHYQLTHALALLALTAQSRLSSRACRVVAALWTAGVLLFSGSIYLLVCHPLLGLAKQAWWGPTTPVGGVLLLAGWAVLWVAALRRPASA